MYPHALSLTHTRFMLKKKHTPLCCVYTWRSVNPRCGHTMVYCRGKTLHLRCSVYCVVTVKHIRIRTYTHTHTHAHSMRIHITHTQRTQPSDGRTDGRTHVRTQRLTQKHMPCCLAISLLYQGWGRGTGERRRGVGVHGHVKQNLGTPLSLQVWMGI